MMNRRTLLAAGPVMAGTLSLEPDASAGVMEDRPPFDIMPQGAQWKIRSWDWTGEAWRPLIARARITSGKIQIEGPVARQDRGAIYADVLGRQARS